MGVVVTDLRVIRLSDKKEFQIIRPDPELGYYKSLMQLKEQGHDISNYIEDELVALNHSKFVDKDKYREEKVLIIEDDGNKEELISNLLSPIGDIIIGMANWAGIWYCIIEEHGTTLKVTHITKWCVPQTLYMSKTQFQTWAIFPNGMTLNQFKQDVWEFNQWCEDNKIQ